MIKKPNPNRCFFCDKWAPSMLQVYESGISFDYETMPEENIQLRWKERTGDVILEIPICDDCYNYRYEQESRPKGFFFVAVCSILIILIFGILRKELFPSYTFDLWVVTVLSFILSIIIFLLIKKFTPLYNGKHPVPENHDPIKSIRTYKKKLEAYYQEKYINLSGLNDLKFYFSNAKLLFAKTRKKVGKIYLEYRPGDYMDEHPGDNMD
jgi:hypothetical protein